MNKENQNIVSEYLDFILQVKGLTQSTIDTKKQHLRVFLNFLWKKKLNQLKLKDIFEFLKELKEKDRSFYSRYSYLGKWKISLITVQHYMATIRNFIKRTNSYSYTSNIDSSLIQSPKVRRSIIDPLSKSELKWILQAPKLFEKRKDIMMRNLLLFQVWYLMGLRVREALNLTFTDLLSSSKITITGKWRKKRTLFIPAIIQENAKKYKRLRSSQDKVTLEYKRWMKTFQRRIQVKYNPSDLLFIRMDSVTYGMPLSRQATSTIFRKYERALWLQKRITYHRLRHTFWTHLLNKNVDLYTLQQMLGHETILATQYYLKANHEKVSHAQKKLLSELPKNLNQVSLNLTHPVSKSMRIMAYS